MIGFIKTTLSFMLKKETAGKCSTARLISICQQTKTNNRSDTGQEIIYIQTTSDVMFLHHHHNHNWHYHHHSYIIIIITVQTNATNWFLFYNMTVLWDCVTCPLLTMHCCAAHTARALLFIFLITNNFS